MEQELEKLKALLATKDIELNALRHKLDTLHWKTAPGKVLRKATKTKCVTGGNAKPTGASQPVCQVAPSNDRLLDQDSISRYGRQLILPELGVKGQLCLSETSVLIVGAGGLGCPAALYLAAAGIGRLGFVDYDEVELSNLHRQILHREDAIGMKKVDSAAKTCSQLNSTVECVPYDLVLDSRNALKLIKEYDVVVDATDNVATRYLLNDACLLTGKPLVSGSALRFEGQLTVYNHDGGPCYRCLFPHPPPPNTVTSCTEGGVLGVVPGIMGCLQALEVIKIAIGIECSYSKKMLLFDALDGSFRVIKLRQRQKECVSCGSDPTLRGLIDYEQFCGSKACDKTPELHLLDEKDRVSVGDYYSFTQQGEPHILIDVRPPVETDICKLPNSKNIPLDMLQSEDELNRLKQNIRQLLCSSDTLPVYIVCRLGNDSQQAVQILKEELNDLPVDVKDIRGGLMAWAQEVDSHFPIY